MIEINLEKIHKRKNNKNMNMVILIGSGLQTSIHERSAPQERAEIF
jgi:hypothetical protein